MCSHDYLPVSVARYEPGKRPMVMFVCSLCSAVEWRVAEPPQQAISAWRHQPTPIPAVFLRAFEGDE